MSRRQAGRHDRDGGGARFAQSVGGDTSPCAQHQTPGDRADDGGDRRGIGVAAGWDETAYYHLVATTALFNLMNRLVEGLGIELDPAYVEPSSKRLAEGGYLPLLKMMKA